MNAISKRDSVYREMYTLLVEYEMKISDLGKFVKEQKKKKPNLTTVNEMNRLKLHRKLLKNNLKFLKTASDKQFRKNRSELKSTFKKAKKAFQKSNDAMAS